MTGVPDANGGAPVVEHTPAPLTHADAVLPVYRSDNQAHGMSCLVICVTAHHQLTAGLPA